MIKLLKFHYQPEEHEAEKASNSYLMSLIAIIAGLPLPIVNLIATLVFFIGNRKEKISIERKKYKWNRRISKKRLTKRLKKKINEKSYKKLNKN